MHDLLLDIGNSATRLSFHDGIGLRRIGRWTTADVDMDALARAIRTHDDHPASSPPAPARPVDASAVSGDGEGTSVTTGHPHPSGKDGNAECPRIWMACVVPALGDVLESSPSWTGGRLLRRLRSTDPEWPPHALATPETTGVDRRLAAWAAAAMAGLSGGDAPVFLDTPRSLETPDRKSVV